jgi:hypothetical protein
VHGSSFFSFVPGWNLIALGYLSELNSVTTQLVRFSLLPRIICYLSFLTKQDLHKDIAFYVILS